jgi:DNA-binding NtrC family response regulator
MHSCEAMGGTVRIVRVAVAHGDPALRRAILRALQSMGAEVYDAETGSGLRGVLRAKAPFDLVVADVWMTGMSGASLVAELRVRGDDTAAILTADELSPGAEASLVNLGYLRVLRTPFNLAEFERAVITLLTS